MIDLKNLFSGDLYHPDDRIGFGKHARKTWNQVKEVDPGYLMWMAGASDDMPDRKKFIDSLFTVQLDLMPDQLAAAEAITEQLLHGTYRVFRLQGGAGYGKSYAVMEIAQRAKKAGFEVKAMANSYVASQVLAESLNPVGIEPTTIARALALRPDTSGFAETYGPSEETEEAISKLLRNGNLLIVDEYSMCSDAVVQLVYAKMNEPGNTSKLLVVGDNKQLPSPEQDYMCDFDTILPAFELDIPKRYKPGSDLHLLEQKLRQDPFMLPQLLLNGSDGGSEQIIKHDTFGALCKQMIQDIKDYPDESAIMLFYRRAAVAAANLRIRAMVYGEDAKALMQLERLRVMRTSFLPVGWNYEKGFMESLKFYSGTFMLSRHPEIESVYIDFNQDFLPANNMHPIEVMCFRISDAEGNRIPVLFSKTEHQADPETVGGKEFNHGLEQVKEYCIEHNNWQLYHYYRSRFVQVAYGYATTVHRSQGSSVDRVYLNPADVLQGGGVAPKLAYVAGTRGKKELHYYINEPDQT